ncbi:hypothetical protein PTI98_013267 [Pleurotus ostreatus]|nr:hypothetical protein PTI98_013267 [Pleurotus ostreatus]
MIGPTSSFYDPDEAQQQQQTADARAQEYHYWAQHQHHMVQPNHPMQTLHQPHPRPHMSHSALTSALGDSGTDPYDYNEYTTAATVFPDHHGASGLAAVASNTYNPTQSQPQGRRVPAVANTTQSSIAQNYHHPHSQPVRQQTHQVGDRSYPYYSDTLTANPHATYTRSQDGGVADMSGSISSNSGNGMPGSSYSQGASSTYSPSSTTTNSPFTHAQSVSPAHGLPSHTSQGHVQQTHSQYSQGQQARQGGQQGAGISSVMNANVPAFPQQQYTNTTVPSQRSPGASGSSGTLGAGAGATTSGGSAKRRATGGGQAAASGGRVSGNYGASSRKRQRGKETDSDSDDEGFAMFPPAPGSWSMASEIRVGLAGVGVESSGGSQSASSRLPGACTHCKKLKMKCDFPKGHNTCKRCKSGGHVCIVEGRKPRTAPNKREYLLAQIRQKDAIIESLLKQLHNPYIATPMSIASYQRATSPSDTNNSNVHAWLDLLRSSVQSAGGKGGAAAFKLHRGDGTGEDESEDEADDSTSRPKVPGLDDDATLDGNLDASQEDEKLQSALPDSHVPLGLIATLALSNSKGKSGGKKDPRAIEEEDDDDVGVANETYFMPGPATDLSLRATLIQQYSPPEILVHGLVTPDDVEKLFEIFYTHVNPFVSLLDPVLHTPALTFARCPFLFTVICAVSSRYYPEKSEVYPIAMHFAKHSAANALTDGWKSVELCQAYILMSIFAVPARRWEEDRSWLYTGLAIRIATDLNLHHVTKPKAMDEKQEREIMNKTRVWMICFNLDRSTATQFGKPFTIKEDHIMRNSKEWYKSSRYNHPYDVHLCAHTALLRIVARFHEDIFSDPDSPTGLNKDVDFRTVTITHDNHLSEYHQEWEKRFQESSDPTDLGCSFRCLLLPFLVEYSRLVMYSFGFQQAFERGIEPGDQLFFKKCLDAAKGVIKHMIQNLAPSGYMRYAPDGHFVFASFASAFLLKLLRPEFSQLLSKGQETEIFELIGRLIQTLSSPQIAIDDRHTPKLYARFLAGLLSRHRRDGATVGRLQTQPPPTQNVSTHSDFSSITMSQAGTSSFAVSPQGSTGEPPSGGFSVTTFSQSPTSEKISTPIYRPEATFSAGSGPIQFGSDFDMLMFGTENGVSEEEMLATMQALKNPVWWQNMMMPGFSWPETASGAESHQALQNNVPGLHAGAAIPVSLY